MHAWDMRKSFLSYETASFENEYNKLFELSRVNTSDCTQAIATSSIFSCFGFAHVKVLYGDIGREMYSCVHETWGCLQ